MPEQTGPITVVHRHRTPDGRWHFDWMIEPAGGPFDEHEQVLCTFRTRLVPWRAREGHAFLAERIGPHRAFYLGVDAHELGGERGTIELVERADVLSFKVEATQIDVRVRAEGDEWLIRGEPLEGMTWRLTSKRA